MLKLLTITIQLLLSVSSLPITYPPALFCFFPPCLLSAPELASVYARVTWMHKSLSFKKQPFICSLTRNRQPDFLNLFPQSPQTRNMRAFTLIVRILTKYPYLQHSSKIRSSLNTQLHPTTNISAQNESSLIQLPSRPKTWMNSVGESGHWVTR